MIHIMKKILCLFFVVTLFSSSFRCLAANSVNDTSKDSSRKKFEKIFSGKGLAVVAGATLAYYALLAYSAKNLLQCAGNDGLAYTMVLVVTGPAYIFLAAIGAVPLIVCGTLTVANKYVYKKAN